MGLDAVGFANGFDSDFRGDLLGHGNGLEVDVENFAADGVVLNLLDEGELVFGGIAILDFEVDEDVFTDGVERRTSRSRRLTSRFAGVRREP